MGLPTTASKTLPGQKNLVHELSEGKRTSALGLYLRALIEGSEKAFTLCSGNQWVSNQH